MRKKAFDALDEMEEAVASKEWGGVKARAVREYIFSLEDYIREIEADYDELEGKL